MDEAIEDVNAFSSDSLSDSEIEKNLLKFMSLKNNYSQARIIDEDGMELFRLNKKDGKVENVIASNLQNKSTRYYFQELKNTIRGNVYVSKIDYNVENNIISKGEITFRIGKQLNDKNHFLILNISPDYLNYLLKSIYKVHYEVNSLVNSEFLDFLFNDYFYQNVNFKNYIGDVENINIKKWDLVLATQTGPIRKSLILSYLVILLFTCLALFFLSLYFEKVSSYAHELQTYKNFVDEICIFSITDLNGKITYANKIFEDVSGYSKEELLGKDHRLINSGFHDKHFFKEIWNIIKSGRQWSGLICNKRKDGAFYWVHSVIAPMFDSSSNINGYAALSFDATKEIELRDTIAQKNDELMRSASLANIGKMSAALSHQLSTPISVISSSVDILNELLQKEIETSDNVRQQFEFLIETIKDIFEVTDSIKQMARTTQYESSGDDYCDLGGCILHVQKLMQSNFQANKIHFSSDIKPDDILVSGNLALLSQVFINLINNSIDSIKVLDERWIKVHSNVSGDKVSVLFTDSGSGIPKEIHDKIFDYFYSTKDLSEGTGLGLSLCQEILIRFGGRIKYNDLSGNTEFEIILKRGDINQAKREEKNVS